MEIHLLLHLNSRFQVKDGYFIHQFSPSGLQPIDKNIVFVIDASESMSGAKLTRVKAALIDILDELHSTDTFNIVSFGADIRYFNNESCVVATSDKIGNAKTFVSSLQAAGGMNKTEIKIYQVFQQRFVRCAKFSPGITWGHFVSEKIGDRGDRPAICAGT